MNKNCYYFSVKQLQNNINEQLLEDGLEFMAGLKWKQISSYLAGCNQTNHPIRDKKTLALDADDETRAIALVERSFDFAGLKSPFVTNDIAHYYLNS